MDHGERHHALSQPGITGVYTDERTGETVVQHDGTQSLITIRRAVSDAADRYEVVSGGMKPQVDRTARHRPIPLSVSISAQDVTAGTAGCWVTRGGDGPFLDTNLHVAGGSEIEYGERQDQPGEHDQVENDRDEWSEAEESYGTLDWWVEPTAELNFVSRVARRAMNWRRRWNTESPKYWVQKTHVMRHDAAHVEPASENVVDTRILGVDAYPREIEAADPGTECMKAGRTTGITRGELVSTDWSGTVVEPWGPTMFEDQLLLEGVDGAMSKGGDSGSWIYWDDWLRAVGRLFAGNSEANQTIANPLVHFRDEYDVAIYSG